MKNKNNQKTINWAIFTIVLLVGVVTATITLADLNSTTHTTFGEESQSRLKFRWNLLHTSILITIIIISTFLVIGWKRLFPFNVPVAIILSGFCYQLFFLAFTVGWVGFQGMIGLLIAFFIGIILIIIYSVSILIEHRRTIKS
jgi:hypothetical protein